MLEPPAHVTVPADAMPFWYDIVRGRARDKWDGHDLSMAAQLARTMADIEKLTKEIATEGHTVINFRGTPMANPKHNVLETLVRREQSLSRILHVHAQAKQGPSGDQAKGLKKQREAGAHIGDADDEMIPRPPATH